MNAADTLRQLGRRATHFSVAMTRARQRDRRTKAAVQFIL